MVKLHKFTVYVWGFNDEENITAAAVANILKDSRQDIVVLTYHEKTAEVGEIGDDHTLNTHPTKDDCERYCDETLNQLYIELQKAQEKLERYKNDKIILKKTVLK